MVYHTTPCTTFIMIYYGTVYFLIMVYRGTLSTVFTVVYRGKFYHDRYTFHHGIPFPELPWFTTLNHSKSGKGYRDVRYTIIVKSATINSGEYCKRCTTIIHDEKVP